MNGLENRLFGCNKIVYRQQKTNWSELFGTEIAFGFVYVPSFQVDCVKRENIPATFLIFAITSEGFSSNNFNSAEQPAATFSLIRFNILGHIDLSWFEIESLIPLSNKPNSLATKASDSSLSILFFLILVFN